MTSKQREQYESLLTRAFNGTRLTPEEEELLNTLGAKSVEQRKLDKIINTYTK
jgi:hypothetical protein